MHLLRRAIGRRCRLKGDPARGAAVRRGGRPARRDRGDTAPRRIGRGTATGIEGGPLRSRAGTQAV